jgi:hypothetical protein
MKSRGWPSVLAVGLAGAVSCSGLGSGGPVPPDYLSHAAGDPRTRSCRFVTDPGALPPFTALARPGTRGTLALMDRDMPPADTIELSARYDETGRLAWVRGIRSSLPQRRVARLEELLLGALNPEGPPDWGFRMHVAGGDIVTIAPSVRCPPEVRQGMRGMVSSPVTSGRQLAVREVRGRPYRAWISLDARGRVVGLRMDATSGHRIDDEFIAQYILSLTFEPQLHDGIPVPSTIRETIYIRDRAY